MSKINHINSSGFPLQIGLEHTIQKTKDQHGWEVIHKEHGWKHHESGESGFIDLVLENRYGTVVLNIECKRPQEATWQFLLPKPHDKKIKKCKYWVTHASGSVTTHFNWCDLPVLPESFQSEFCVVSGQDNKSRPMIERVCSELVESTESVAKEEIALCRTYNTPQLRTYFNAIVTTAKIEVCKFDPNEIDLNTGKISNADFDYVPFIRFRKQLTVRPQTLNNVTDFDKGIKKIAEAKEMTVFIIQANELIQFLIQLELGNEIGRYIHNN